MMSGSLAHNGSRLYAGVVLEFLQLEQLPNNELKIIKSTNAQQSIVGKTLGPVIARFAIVV